MLPSPALLCCWLFFADLTEIGREQFCAKFHKDSLRDMAYCALRDRVVTCGETCIKIVDMKDWKVRACSSKLLLPRAYAHMSSCGSFGTCQELDSEVLADKDSGRLDRIAWTADGNLISVSTKLGFLHIFSVLPRYAPIFQGLTHHRAFDSEQKHALCAHVSLFASFTSPRFSALCCAHSPFAVCTFSCVRCCSTLSAGLSDPLPSSFSFLSSGFSSSSSSSSARGSSYGGSGGPSGLSLLLSTMLVRPLSAMSFVLAGQLVLLLLLLAASFAFDVPVALILRVLFAPDSLPEL